MNRTMLPTFVLLAPLLSAANGEWVLATSTLSYHVSHSLQETEGVTHAAHGKGICQNGECNFLITVPVKSFESGDTKRDIQMIQATRGALFPMVTVRLTMPDAAIGAATFVCDVEIEFAGQKVTYHGVTLAESKASLGTRVTGTIPATLSDFKIEPPSLLSIPVKNEMPIKVDMTWRPGP
jgi:hypothetical protein